MILTLSIIALVLSLVGNILVNNKPKMLYGRILIHKKAGVLFTV